MDALIPSFRANFTNVIAGQYADFSGRSSRTLFWMFHLYSALLSLLLTVLQMIIMPDARIGDERPLNLLFSLAIFLPSFGLYIRRFHDAGFSGWWLLLLPMLIVTFFPSRPDVNRWGDEPHPEEEEQRASVERHYTFRT